MEKRRGEKRWGRNKGRGEQAGYVFGFQILIRFNKVKGFSDTHAYKDIALRAQMALKF